MKLQSFLISILFIVLLQSCWNSDFPGYNEIVFVDSTKRVADSLVLMETLLNMLPKFDGVNCFINNKQELIINNTTIGLWASIKADSSTLTSNRLLSEISIENKVRLISLLSFLNRNGINGAYFSERLNTYMFLYQENEFNYLEHEYRNIVVAKPITQKFLESYKILDEKEGLLLIAPK